MVYVSQRGKMGRLDRVVGVRLAKGDVRRLKRIAEEKGLRVSQLIRMILKEWLEGGKKR